MRTVNPRPSSLRVVVLGYLVRGPIGGLAWHHLQYAAGLHHLGHDVLFVEDSGDYPACVHLEDREVDTDPEEGLAFAGQALARLGLEERWAYHDAHRNCWRGPAASRAEAFCRSADIVINISAINPLRDWWAGAPIRALIDTDPVFVQVRHIRSEEGRAYAQAHNAFFTFAEKYGQSDCTVPHDGFPWRPTRQPVVLDEWPLQPLPQSPLFTTVMQWDSYRTVEYEGVNYGMKSHAFDPYIDLPAHSVIPLELAIGGNSNPPVNKLRQSGWRIRDPHDFNQNPWDYQHYIYNSSGEFSIAKQGYVISHSGWFSERSANYLAAGRPVILQDTGFSDMLPTGMGLLTFETPQEAAQILHQVQNDLPHHSEAARAIAEDCFDSRIVLSRLLEQAMDSARVPG